MMSNYNWGFLPSSGQVFEYVCVLLLLLLLLLLGLPVATITRPSLLSVPVSGIPRIRPILRSSRRGSCRIRF